MFVDARTLPDGSDVEADICIIGCGAAGIMLARDLAGGSRRIAVFESGGFEFDEETQALYDGENVGQPFPPLAMDRLRYFGGTTNHWEGSCRPFDPVDFESRDYVKNSGWPFGRDELEPYYRRAHDICQLGRYTYDPKDWSAKGALPFDFGPDGSLRSGIYQYSPPTRFGDVYRHDLETAPGVVVYLHSNLVDIETDPDARAVTGLQLAGLKGPRLRAKSKQYVLATGGIENARLLLNFNKVQREGLGNRFDLVGRYFMDHPYIPNAATVLFDERSVAQKFYDRLAIDGHAQFYLYAPASVLEKARLPTFSIVIQRAENQNHVFAKASLVSILHAIRSGQWPERLSYHVGQILRGIEYRIEQSYDKLVQAGPSSYATNYMCECAPDPESRLTLIEATDALGLRRVELDWRLPSEFIDNLRSAHGLLAQDIGRAGLGRLRINVDEGNLEQLLLTGHHHMGTTRMHRDPRKGVVDENSRVHGLANLFIAGSSVFPTYSFDDPTMTIVALSLRLSDHLKATLVEQ